MTEAARQARNAYMREYRRQHREEINEYNKTWRHQHPERVSAYNKEYWEKKAAAAGEGVQP